MKYTDDYDNERDIRSSSGRDISSKSYEDISSASPQYRREQQLRSQRRTAPVQRPSAMPPAKKKKKKHIVRNIIIALVCIIIVSGVAFYAYTYSILNNIQQIPLDTDDLGIATDDFGAVQNIALLGLDTRQDNNVGRSDAIIVLTIDKTHKKIKLTSLARDTYVAIDGHGHDKLTHAYAYGKSQLAVKTINQNFGLEITDYVTVNFFELSHIIDYIGGVYIDVNEEEIEELNNNIFPEMRSLGIDAENLTAPGTQLLTGGQAVGFARIRHIDNDVERGNRQKEVLTAMFAQAKKQNPLKLPKLIEMIASECETSLTTNEMMSLGFWALLFSPEFEQLSIPNPNVPSSGKYINGRWCYVYDLDVARDEIYDFIFEENYYSEEAVAERESSSSESASSK